MSMSLMAAEFQGPRRTTKGTTGVAVDRGHGSDSGGEGDDNGGGRGEGGRGSRAVGMVQAYVGQKVCKHHICLNFQ